MDEGLSVRHEARLEGIEMLGFAKQSDTKNRFNAARLRAAACSLQRIAISHPRFRRHAQGAG
jgi:hypothetical protein